MPGDSKKAAQQQPAPACGGGGVCGAGACGAGAGVCGAGACKQPQPPSQHQQGSNKKLKR